MASIGHVAVGLAARSPIGRRFFCAEGLRVALIETAAFAIPFVYGLWPKRHRPGV